ncbi:MAG TPA: alpha-amylase family glycosyl hydrolase [Candidatus Angelobacter sp.]|nr:alpha-amylase family glycosyl hydrolase [Candidatus Angelobacter sp.]
MVSFLRRLFNPAALLLLTTSLCWSQDFKKQVIYQIVTDRFFNGDAANDNPSQSAGLFDATKTNWRLYWGGDLAGIQQKMSYIKGLGATAIWISPPVDNVNLNDPVNGSPAAPYHGYAARDFKRIEEHFGDANNTFAAFDNLVSTAHANGIKVIVDFAPNHSNDNSAAEFGSLFDNGTFVAACNNDPNGVFHHNPNIADFNDRYQLQYYTLFSLCDLNQESPAVDAYLKAALLQLQQHGVDAFRIDAVKHVTWGWEYSMANAAFSSGPSFFYGEWFLGGTGDPLFHDAYKFANNSGISLLDFSLNTAIRDVFANDTGFTEIDNTLSTENATFTWQNDQVTFIDSHDVPRFLTVNNNTNRLNEATAFLLTCRGIPVIFYGDEQFLHNDTNGGGDPFNRLWMSSFDTTTVPYKLIGHLSALRQGNNSIAYGGFQQRWINNDVYIYERKFFNDVVLVAINKNDTTPYSITGLNTALPAGNYSDYLAGLLGGFGIGVSAGTGGNNPVAAFTLPAHTVSVWQATATAAAPQVGSIGPTVGQSGVQVTIAGKGFGGSAGSILFGAVAANVVSWADSQVVFMVPGVSPGVYNVQLKKSGGTAANAIQFRVLTANLIPVTFTVNNASPTNVGDYIFLTGGTVELGNWGTTFDTAIGPMLDPNNPNWFLNVSVPAGQTIQFKFIKIAANGAVTWENGSNHIYTVPTSGTGFVNVNWQN